MLKGLGPELHVARCRLTIQPMLEYVLAENTL